jgi:hypothetical protein
MPRRRRRGCTDVADRLPLLPVKIFLSSPGDLFPERALAKTFVTQELAIYPHLKGT